MKRPRLTCEISRSPNGNYYWRLRATNGRILADSAEGYDTHAGLLKALRLLSTYANAAFEAALEPEPVTPEPEPEDFIRD